MTKELTPLLAHLNQALNNYKITFEIKVEAQKSEEYVYGVKDKYEYLKKINPDIEVLKKNLIWIFKNTAMLGLKLPTDPRWVNIVEKNIHEILTDHAFCEQKGGQYCHFFNGQIP